MYKSNSLLPGIAITVGGRPGALGNLSSQYNAA